MIRFTEEQATKAQRGVNVSSILSLISSLVGGGWSTPRPGRFTPGKNPVPIYVGGWLEPGPVWKGAENLAPSPRFDPWTVKPIASRYTDWAISAHRRNDNICDNSKAAGVM